MIASLSDEHIHFSHLLGDDIRAETTPLSRPWCN